MIFRSLDAAGRGRTDMNLRSRDFRTTSTLVATFVFVVWTLSSPCCFSSVGGPYKVSTLGLTT
jgi:hypothetical protein